MHIIYESSTSFFIPKNSLTGNSYMNLKSKLSTIDFKTEQQIPKAFFEIKGETKDDTIIAIPKISKDIILSVTRNYYTYKDIKMGYDENIPYKLNYNPLPHQEKLADKLVKHFILNEDKRIILALSPGLSITKPLRI